MAAAELDPDSRSASIVQSDSNIHLQDQESTTMIKHQPTIRKGKWTAEEEEFALRIIEQFDAGLLILTNGKTLRAYLAEKLNCDPMRITKKFTGAYCLAKRSHHNSNPPFSTPTQRELAKAELEYLERRFRKSICQDVTNPPVSRGHEQASFDIQPQYGGSAARSAIQAPALPGRVPLHFLIDPGKAGGSINDSLFNSQIGNQALSLTAGPPSTSNSWSTNLASPPTGRNLPIDALGLARREQPQFSMQLLNSLATSLGLTKANVPIPSPAPALSEPAVMARRAPMRSVHTGPTTRRKPKVSTEELLRDLRNAYKEYLRKENEKNRLLDGELDSETDDKSRGSSKVAVIELSPVEQLTRGYLSHLESLKKTEKKESKRKSSRKQQDSISSSKEGSSPSTEDESSSAAREEPKIELTEHKKEAIAGSAEITDLKQPLGDVEAGSLLLRLSGNSDHAAEEVDKKKKSSALASNRKSLVSKESDTSSDAPPQNLKSVPRRAQVTDTSSGTSSSHETENSISPASSSHNSEQSSEEDTDQSEPSRHTRLPGKRQKVALQNKDGCKQSDWLGTGASESKRDNKPRLEHERKSHSQESTS